MTTTKILKPIIDDDITSDKLTLKITLSNVYFYVLIDNTGNEFKINKEELRRLIEK